MTNQPIEEKCREVAQKIVDLTGYGQALHVNDILPDLRELTENLLEQERQKEPEFCMESPCKKTDCKFHDAVTATEVLMKEDIVERNRLAIEGFKREIITEERKRMSDEIEKWNPIQWDKQSLEEMKRDIKTIINK